LTISPASAQRERAVFRFAFGAAARFAVLGAVFAFLTVAFFTGFVAVVVRAAFFRVPAPAVRGGALPRGVPAVLFLAVLRAFAEAGVAPERGRFFGAAVGGGEVRPDGVPCAGCGVRGSLIQNSSACAREPPGFQASSGL
jgi:hypothetical protein